MKLKINTILRTGIPFAGLIVSSLSFTSFVPAWADSVEFSAGGAVAARMSTYTSQAGGYSIEYPDGWQISTDPHTGQLNVLATDSARMSVLPFFIGGKSIAVAGAEKERIEIFKTLLHATAPDIKWASPVVLNADALKVVGDGARSKINAIVLLRNATNGLIGQLCMTSRPVGMNPDTPKKFAQMLSTFRYAARASGGAMPASMSSGMTGGMNRMPSPRPVNYRTFVDPTENAFSCDVPVGWNAIGGIRRLNGLDTRPWVKIVSPDNSVMIFLGDNEVPSFTIPNATLRGTGFGAGRQYGGSTVMPYNTAVQFMKRYSQQRLSQTISELKMVQTQDHPDIDRTVNGPSQIHSCSSAKFTGVFRGAPGVCYLLCATRANIIAGSGMWWVTSLSGVITTAEQDQQALSTYAHIYQSMQTNPQWAGQNSASIGAITKANIAASNAKSQSIVDSYWARQAPSVSSSVASEAPAATGDGFDNYIRGTADMQDPTTGQTYNVTYGPETHWINNNGGTIFGADNSFQPGTDWHQLIDAPR